MTIDPSRKQESKTPEPAAAPVHESWCGEPLGVGCTCQAPHDYAYELAEYTAGRRPHPPCLSCAGPVRDGGITGAELCEECCV